MIRDPDGRGQAAAADDLKGRVGPGERHSLRLDVWGLPANLIGGSGGDPPPPLEESRLFCGWSFECQTAGGWPRRWSPRRPGNCVSGSAVSFLTPCSPLTVCCWGEPEPPALSSILGTRGDLPGLGVRSRCKSWPWHSAGSRWPGDLTLRGFVPVYVAVRLK